MNKLVISNQDLTKLVSNLCRQITLSGWKPDYIIGISRGGLIPAVMISHYLGIPMKPLQVSLRDSGDCVSDFGMAEDALGYPKQEKSIDCKNILIVDDINDSGATFNWIMNDWPSGCLPDDPGWEFVWNKNVKFAVLIDNLSSKCRVGMDFVGLEINKSEDDVWVDFPWEEWWSK
jgi:xanthine phosphoribosyltransferase